MADFRRWIFALAMLALVVGSVAPASAQQTGSGVTCSASASVSPILRAEGLTELTGDILLTCTANPNAAPIAVGTPVPQADISVTLSYPLTTKYYGTPTPTNLETVPTDALLFVDDAQPINQQVCNNPANPVIDCQVIGFGAGSFNSSAPGRYNVFQGVLGGPGQSSQAGIFYSITFLGVPVDPPVTSRTYRITNVRINASGQGIAQGNLFPVIANVTSSSSTSISIPSPQVTVGFVTPGLASTPASLGLSFLQCQDYPQAPVGSITFKELFATAFKVKDLDPTEFDQNSPGTVYYSESGLEVSVLNGTVETGVADTGTELQATIANIPSNVTIYADCYAVSLASVPGNLSDATMVSPVSGCTSEGGIVALNPNGETTVTAVWEVTNTNSSAIDTLVFNIYSSVVGNPALPIGPTTTMSGSFWPLATTWVDDDPIPEFSSNVSLTLNPVLPSLFAFSPCQTILLFPYVTELTGFNTGIAISNTSMDPLALGAKQQSGPCSVYFYADGALATNFFNSDGAVQAAAGVWSSTDSNTINGEINATATNPGWILPGQTWAFELSSLDPLYGSTPSYGTSGYAIAVCNFQYAHGYSFVSDTNVGNFAAAYLALIIPDAPRTPQPFVCSATGGCTGFTQPGEQLVH